MLTVSRRRPSWSLAWATWTSPWVSTPMVTRVGWACAMVVMAISLRGWVDGTRRPGGRTALRWVCGHRLLSGQACSAGGARLVAAASGRQIRSRARSRWTAGVRPLPRPPQRSSQWTLDRIATVIWRVTGVRHHPAQVWGLLRHRLDWSLQRPTRRAQARDEQAIRQWVASDWPRIKERQARQGRHLLLRRVRRFADSDRALDLGAPRQDSGAGPSVQLEACLDRGRVVGWLRCGGGQLAFHVQPGSYNTDSLIGVLGELRRFLGGQKATLLWDGCRPIPATRCGRSSPASAIAGGGAAARRCPELNPTQALWGNLKGKGGELADLAGDPLEEVIGAAQRGIDRVRRTPHLPYSLLRHSGLDLW